MKTLSLYNHRPINIDLLKAVFKRGFVVRSGAFKTDAESNALVTNIYKSDQFTLDQAYQDFAHIPLRSRSADN